MPKHGPGTPLPGRIRDFIATPRPAILGSVDPDGSPRTAVIWYLPAADGLIINSLEGRLWPANLRRVGRASVAVVDGADGLSWVGLQGAVEVDEDRARALADISAMAWLYEPETAATTIRDRFSHQTRVSFHLRVDEYHDHIGG
jgi:hypothetical protein